MARGGKRNGAGRKPGSKSKPKTPAATVAAAPTSAPETAPAPVDNAHGLEPRRLLFVELYTGECKFNASAAYLKAGFKGKPGKVSGLAARLIADDRVAAAVAARLGSRLLSLQMSGDEALEGISNVARADIRKLFDERGNIRAIVDLDDEIADCLESVEVVARPVPGTRGQETEYVHKFKLHDKLRARELMAKAAGKLNGKAEAIAEAIGRIVDELHP